MGKKKKFDILDHQLKTIKLGTTETLNIPILFSMGPAIPPAGQPAFLRTTRSATMLSGIPTMTHGSIGLIKMMDQLKTPKKKKR